MYGCQVLFGPAPTCFMEECYFCAKKKNRCRPVRRSRRQSSGSSTMLTPSASSTSAAPLFDEAALFPCLATGNTGRCNHDGRGGGDIERAGAVSAAVPDDFKEIHVVLHFQRMAAHGSGAGRDLIDRLTFRTQRGEERSRLDAGCLSAHDLVHNVAGLRHT